MQQALEMHRHVTEILTFLAAPGIPSAVCQGDDYRVSAEHRLQQSVAISL